MTLVRLDYDLPPAVEPLIRESSTALLSRPVSEEHAQTVLSQLAHRAYQLGRDQAVLELLTTEQAAAQLGVSERHVRRIARERSLGWQIQDGVWLFRPADVAAMQARAPRGRPARRPG